MCIAIWLRIVNLIKDCMEEEKVYDRRAADKAHLDIRELILKTDSPKDKAMLLILLKISESLEANTSMTHEVSIKLDEHLDNFVEHEKQEEIKNAQIKAGWRVLSGVLILLQSLALYTVKSHFDEANRMNLEILSIRKDVDILKDHDEFQNSLGMKK